MLANKTMVQNYRGCTVTLKGCVLPEVLDALVRAHGYSQWNAQMRTTNKEMWAGEVKDLRELMNKVWELARKAQRKRDRRK